MQVLEVAHNQRSELCCLIDVAEFSLIRVVLVATSDAAQEISELLAHTREVAVEVNVHEDVEVLFGLGAALSEPNDFDVAMRAHSDAGLMEGQWLRSWRGVSST